MASVFSSHPDESNIVEKIIAMNVKRSVVFMGAIRIEQIGNLRCAADFNVEVVMWKFSRRSAVRWSAWLDVSVAQEVVEVALQLCCVTKQQGLPPRSFCSIHV